MIWKAKAGKQLPIAVARELIKTGYTARAVTGFRGRSGRSFRARLALSQTEDGQMARGVRRAVGEGGRQAADAEADDEAARAPGGRAAPPSTSAAPPGAAAFGRASRRVGGVRAGWA